MKVLILGGHGKVALRLAPLLHERGDEVTSVFRNPDHEPEVAATGARPVVADLETLSTQQAESKATADEWGRALNKDGSPIDGLYAVGNAAANAFGKFYPGPGATLGQGTVFAYIAARHACERARSSEALRASG